MLTTEVTINQKESEVQGALYTSVDVLRVSLQACIGNWTPLPTWGPLSSNIFAEEETAYEMCTRLTGFSVASCPFLHGKFSQSLSGVVEFTPVNRVLEHTRIIHQESKLQGDPQAIAYNPLGWRPGENRQPISCHVLAPTQYMQTEAFACR